MFHVAQFLSMILKFSVIVTPCLLDFQTLLIIIIIVGVVSHI